MKQPKILFLDEPTSGLDSSTSISVSSLLKKLAKLGMTIIMTIHQPRTEIFTSIDDLILLIPGGKLVYCGPTKNLEAYFASLDYICPPKVNVADFCIDVLAGITPDINLTKTCNSPQPRPRSSSGCASGTSSLPL